MASRVHFAHLTPVLFFTRLHLVMYCVIITTSDGIFRIPKWLEDNLPFLNISEKLHWEHLFEKLVEAEAETHRLHLCYKIQYLHTLKNNIYHSNKRGPPPFFHSDTNPVLGHVLIHSVEKTHVLVVHVELIWLLFLIIPSFNFASTKYIFLGSQGLEDTM